MINRRMLCESLLQDDIIKCLKSLYCPSQCQLCLQNLYCSFFYWLSLLSANQSLPKLTELTLSWPKPEKRGTGFVMHVIMSALLLSRASELMKIFYM